MTRRVSRKNPVRFYPHDRSWWLICDRPIEQVLDLVDLSGAASRRISGFSLGMRQRLALASALLGDPQILILDEPANGLDPEGTRWLRQFLRGLAGEGRTIFVSSHVLAEAAHTVDHVVVIGRGRLVTQSPLADLTAQAAPVMRIRTPDPARLAAVVSVDGGQARLTGGDQVESPRRLPDGSQNSPPGSPSLSSRASPSRPAWRTCSSG
jgi:ABC-2 type transport system ATP-binding protein